MNTAPAFIPAASRMREPSIALITKCTAVRFGVTVSEMLSARRQKRLVAPRHIAMHLARKMTRRSFPFIGRHLGGYDHTSVINGDRKIQTLLDSGHRETLTAVSEIETAVLASQMTGERLDRDIIVDADAVDLAERILDGDPHRISLDDLRTMACFIRSFATPIVEMTQPRSMHPPVAPTIIEIAQVPSPVMAVMPEALGAWAEWTQNEFTSNQKFSRNRLGHAMAALKTAFERNRS